MLSKYEFALSSMLLGQLEFIATGLQIGLESAGPCGTASDAKEEFWNHSALDSETADAFF